MIVIPPFPTDVGEKRVLTLPEFLQRYNLKRSKFYLLKKEGLAPKTITVGRRVYIAVEDAEAWLNSLRGKEAA